MIIRRLGSKAREDVQNKRIVLETLEHDEDKGYATAKLNNSAEDKVMRLRIYDPSFSDPNFSGSPIYLNDLDITTTRRVYSTREYICTRISLVNQNGEELVVTTKDKGGDE